MKSLFKGRLVPMILATVLIMSFLITGCATDKEEDVIVIKLGHHYNVDAVVDDYCNKFADLANTKSNGRLKVEVYPGSQLGSELEVAEGVLLGTQQMGAVSTSAYNNLIKGFGIDTLPFMYDSYEDIMDVFTETEVGEELEDRILERDGRIVSWIALGGSRIMIFADKDIKSVKEMEGLKMRSPEIDLFVGTFEALGARPTPIPWGETYTALQTKVVDGTCAPSTGVKDMKFHEVTKYGLLTNHIRSTFNLVINESFFQTIPEDLQEILLDAGREASEYGQKLSMEEEDQAVDFLLEQGMVLYEVSQDEMDMMKDALAPVIDKWGQEHDATELIQILRERKQ